MAKAYIVCRNCGNHEEINKHLFFKIIGGALSGGGFYAWVAYIFAGTGLAMPICIAIILGGVGIAAYSNEIAGWLSKRYKCSECGYKSWSVEKDLSLANKIKHQKENNTIFKKVKNMIFKKKKTPLDWRL